MNGYTVHRLPDGGVTLFRDGSEVLPERAHALLGAIRAAYNFGYAGEGPRVLALALLLDALRNAEAAFAAHGAFAAEFFNTSTAASEELQFSRDELLDWFKSYAIRSSR